MSNQTKKTPLVSIVCDVFNHEHFLHDCLNGFLIQEVDFDYEILIHDDASTDNSPSIIKDYQKRYPNLFIPIFQTINQYSKGIGSWKTIQFPRARGKYIAICEGDDYWIDKHKLQKQVDFLERHPDYSMCFHNAIEHFEDNSREDHLFSNIENRDYTGLEIYEKWQVPTASVVIRKTVLESETYHKLFFENNLLCGDIPLFLSASSCGKIRGLKEIMSVYRRQITGATAKPFFEKEATQLRLAKMSFDIASVMGKDYLARAEKNYLLIYLRLFRLSKEAGKPKWEYLWKAFFKYPKNIFRFSFSNHNRYIKLISKIIFTKYKNK